MAAAAERCALVTGAGTGIGRAIARRLAAANMQLLVVGRREAPLCAIAAETGARICIADIAAPAGRQAILRALPPALELLVHSAGAFHRGPIERSTAAEWSALLTVNLEAPMLLTAACLPHLRAGRGQVVFVNSTAGLNAGANAGVYAASKAALRAAADALRQEVNKDGIRVLSLFPGRTDTPMQDAVLAAEGRTAPAGTLMDPDDVASMVLAATTLPRTAEVTEITMRPARAF